MDFVLNLAFVVIVIGIYYTSVGVMELCFWQSKAGNWWKIHTFAICITTVCCSLFAWLVAL